MFRTRDWAVLGPVGALALGLAIWGFGICAKCGCVGTAVQCAQEPSFGALVQKSVEILIGRGIYSLARGDPWQLVVAAYLVPGVALFAAAKLFLGNFQKDVRVAFARNSRGHTIVCGLGDTGRHVVQNLRAIGKRVVVIDTVNDSPHAVSCENDGVPVIKGDATDAKTLELAGLVHARAVVLTSGDDSVNLEIALRADEVAGKRSSAAHRLRVHAEMRNDWLYRTLTAHRGAVLGSARIEFRAFNAHENAARLLFREIPFTRRRLAMAATAPHLIVVGFGRMGREVVAHAVRTAFALPTERLAVTVVDQNGEAAANEFFSTYSGIRDLADIDFIASALTTAAPDHWAPVDAALEARPPTAVIICLPDDEQSLFVALGFRARLDELQHTATSVFVRLRQSRKLGDFTSKIEQVGPLQDRLVPFGDLGYLTSVKVLFDDDLDTLARAHHEQWLTTAELRGEPRNSAQLPWAQLAETFKQANRQFADHVSVKLRAAGLHLRPSPSPKIMTLTDSEVNELAVMEHWRWSIERRMAGWRYGPERDNIRRLHPVLVGWSELDEKWHKENRDQVQKLPEMLAKVGHELEREEIISAIGPALIPAGERVEGFRAPRDHERLIVVTDPLDPRAVELARTVAPIANVSVWLLLSRKAISEFAKGPDSTGGDGLEELSGLAGGWISPQELDHLAARQTTSPRTPASTGAGGATLAKAHSRGD